jgi:branched-chain amino acid transport system ATP-binding protein
MSPALLSLRGISAGYGRVPVLHGVRLDVRAGEVVCVAGPNGAGKTTLTRVISGLLRAWSGTIELRGRDISRLRAEKVVRRGLSHVPQGRHVFTGLTVRENLVIGATPARALGASRVRAEVGRWMERFPILAARADQPAGVLSGGEQQILAICRALMAQPALVVMDEPTLGLSPAAREVCLTLVEELRSEGRGVVLVEQTVTQRVAQVSDSMCWMSFGELSALSEERSPRDGRGLEVSGCPT